jgi:hypothetical protein
MANYHAQTPFQLLRRYIFIAIFVWEWFPEYIAPTLTGISIFCLANKNSPWFTRVFGGAAGNEGLGAFLIGRVIAYL